MFVDELHRWTLLPVPGNSGSRIRTLASSMYLTYILGVADRTPRAVYPAESIDVAV